MELSHEALCECFHSYLPARPLTAARIEPGAIDDLDNDPAEVKHLGLPNVFKYLQPSPLALDSVLLR